MNLLLRDLIESDLPFLFEFHKDEEANKMAAFVSRDPSDRQAFDNHWHRILADPALIMKTIEREGEIVGSIGKFEMFGLPQVTYWVGRQYWGCGIATRALGMLLNQIPLRPLYASAAHDNAGSIRVLEKNGFIRYDTDRGYANARQCEIEEILFKLQN